jgi:hypothetical protein
MAFSSKATPAENGIASFFERKNEMTLFATGRASFRFHRVFSPAPWFVALYASRHS